jgi:site-specific recombinase XerD
VQTSSVFLGDFDRLDRWYSAFLVDRKSCGYSPCTLKFYRVELVPFLDFCGSLGVLRFQDLTADLLRQYFISLGERGRNPGGIHAGYRAVKTFLFWYEAETDPVAWVNPIRKVKPPKVPAVALEPVSLRVVSKLVDACSGETVLDLRDRALFLFLLDTGARAFEVCGLDLGDVDLVLGTCVVRSGKGGKSRQIVIGRKTRRTLRAYLRLRSDSNPALWLARCGDRLSYYGLNRVLKNRALQAGVPKPGLHDFRRAFALNCLRAGMDVYSLQKLMGHSDLQVLRRYLAQTDSDLLEAHGRASPVDLNL